MVFDWQKVQTKEGETARNGPTHALEVAHQTTSGFGRIHLGLRMEQLGHAIPEDGVVDVQADRKYLLGDFIGDAEHFVIVGVRLQTHLVVKHGAGVITNVHRGINSHQEKADPIHVTAP